MKKKPHLQITIPDNYYDTVKHHMELVTTGEEIDINAKMQSLTTLYQSLVAKGDPRSDQILDKIMSLTGENLESVLGGMQPQATPTPTPQLPPSQGMNQLAMNNAPKEQAL